MDGSLISRLREFIDSTGYNNSQFADMCNIPRPSLSQILTGRNKKISNQILEQLHEAFPDLNISWLLFGEGEMLISNSQNPSEIPESVAPRPYDEIFSKEIGLTTPEFGGYTNGNQQFEGYEKIAALQAQIDKLQLQLENFKKNPRKVVQITIYYDDSTFETFNP